MKRLLSLILLAFSIPIFADDTPFDWSGLERSKISLEAHLLIVKGSLGFLDCGYINTDSCIDEACAIVSGVNTHPFLIKSANVRAELERREALTYWEWERIDLKYNQMQGMSELAITCAGKGNRYAFGG